MTVLRAWVAPSGHVAAAAPSFNFQSDLLAASAAKALDYMECQSVQQTLQAAAPAAAWVGNPFVVIVFHMSGWSLDPGFAGVLFSGTWSSTPWKRRTCIFGKGNKQGSTSKGSEESCYSSDLQALTHADSGEAHCFEEGAESEGECVLFKGKDGHDTDGSLSLGSGEA